MPHSPSTLTSKTTVDLVSLKLQRESVYFSPSSLLGIHYLSPGDHNSLLIILPALTLVPFQFFLEIETRLILQKYNCIHVNPLYKTLQYLLLHLE